MIVVTKAGQEPFGGFHSLTLTTTQYVDPVAASTKSRLLTQERARFVFEHGNGSIRQIVPLQVRLSSHERKGGQVGRFPTGCYGIR
jgi:hypothetical protein